MRKRMLIFKRKHHIREHLKHPYSAPRFYAKGRNAGNQEKKKGPFVLWYLIEHANAQKVSCPRKMRENARTACAFSAAGTAAAIMNTANTRVFGEFFASVA